MGTFFTHLNCIRFDSFSDVAHVYLIGTIITLMNLTVLRSLGGPQTAPEVEPS